MAALLAVWILLFLASVGFTVWTFWTATHTDAFIGAMSAVLAYALLIFGLPWVAHQMGKSAPPIVVSIAPHFAYGSWGAFVLGILVECALVVAFFDALSTSVASRLLPGETATPGRHRGMAIGVVLLFFLILIGLCDMFPTAFKRPPRMGFGRLVDAAMRGNELAGDKYIVVEDPFSLTVPNSLLSADEVATWTEAIESLKTTDELLKGSEIVRIDRVKYQLRDDKLSASVVFDYKCGDEQIRTERRFPIADSHETFIENQEAAIDGMTEIRMPSPASSPFAKPAVSGTTTVTALPGVSLKAGRPAIRLPNRQ